MDLGAGIATMGREILMWWFRRSLSHGLVAAKLRSAPMRQVVEYRDTALTEGMAVRRHCAKEASAPPSVAASRHFAQGMPCSARLIFFSKRTSFQSPGVGANTTP